MRNRNSSSLFSNDVGRKSLQKKKRKRKLLKVVYFHKSFEKNVTNFNGRDFRKKRRRKYWCELNKGFSFYGLLKCNLFIYN